MATVADLTEEVTVEDELLVEERPEPRKIPLFALDAFLHACGLSDDNVQRLDVRGNGVIATCIVSLEDDRALTVTTPEGDVIVTYDRFIPFDRPEPVAADHVHDGHEDHEH